jgi:hypothetical protein
VCIEITVWAVLNFRHLLLAYLHQNLSYASQTGLICNKYAHFAKWRAGGRWEEATFLKKCFKNQQTCNSGKLQRNILFIIHVLRFPSISVSAVPRWRAEFPGTERKRVSQM